MALPQPADKVALLYLVLFLLLSDTFLLLMPHKGGHSLTETLQCPPRLKGSSGHEALGFSSFQAPPWYLCIESRHLLPEGCVDANGKVFPETHWRFEVGWVRDDPETRHLYPLPLEALVGLERAGGHASQDDDVISGSSLLRKGILNTTVAHIQLLSS